MIGRRSQAITFGLLVALAAAQTEANDRHEGTVGQALAPTLVSSETDAERLRTLQGVTLQWIGWDRRGKVSVTRSDEGQWSLAGAQEEESGAGLRLEGFITEIGKDYFLFDGRIQIADTPMQGRSCDARKIWRFEATQRRAYYRLREFEWCDGLTDYIDLYFAPGLR